MGEQFEDESEVEAARLSYALAGRRCREACKRKDDWLADRRREAEAEAARLFNGEIELAAREEGERREVWQQVVEAQALAAKREIPLGTMMEEWQPVKISMFHYGDLAPTGRKGILEVITADSEHPGNKMHASRGDLVIRLLKKDGKPGRDYVRRQYDIEYHWRPAQ